LRPELRPGTGGREPAYGEREVEDRTARMERRRARAGLFAAGALWNSFLFAVKGATLVRLFEERLPELAVSFARVFAGGASGRATRLEALYAGLDTHDFSRDVLQANEPRLRLEIVPPCGWTDLGTPARVEACLAGLGEEPGARPATFHAGRAVLDLALAVRGLAAPRSGAQLGAQVMTA